jgi:8-oxo-dGTP diphosphatase
VSPSKRIEVRVAGILVRDGKVLMVKHRKPEGEYWVVPGGRLDYGETLCHALKREFNEELSLSVEVGKLVFLNDAAPVDGERHVLNIYFVVESDGRVDTGKLEGVEGAEFFSPDELGGIDLRPPITDTLREVIDCGRSEQYYLGNLWA